MYHRQNNTVMVKYLFWVMFLVTVTNGHYFRRYFYPHHDDCYHHHHDQPGRLTVKDSQELKDIRKQCVSQTGISQELVDGTGKGEFPDDPKLKEFLTCVSKATGVLSDDNVIDQAKARDLLLNMRHISDPKVVDEILNRCSYERATTEETSYQSNKCQYGVLKEHNAEFL